jgi:glycosyltransferase involved in cell wall biosynthesis
MLLTVVIPTHNRCSLLNEAMCSVVRQKVSPYEIIVCDDGSTEDMAGVRDNFPASDAGRLVWSRTEQCQGAPVARNRGLALAQGEFVLFMDSDDVLADGGLAPLHQVLVENPQLDYAYAKVIQTDAQLQPFAENAVVGAPFTSTPVDVAGYHWHTMGAVYRKSYLAKVGPWNEALTGSQDWEYQARVKLAGGRGQFVDTVVGYWRHHGGSRVGASTFRPDYVRSVMLACDSIRQHARRAGRCDRPLERRLAKKLILHAVEWGANGHPAERRQCLAQAAQTVASDPVYQALIKCFQISPGFMDAQLWKVLTQQRGNWKIKLKC